VQVAHLRGELRTAALRRLTFFGGRHDGEAREQREQALRRVGKIGLADRPEGGIHPQTLGARHRWRPLAIEAHRPHAHGIDPHPGAARRGGVGRGGQVPERNAAPLRFILEGRRELGDIGVQELEERLRLVSIDPLHHVHRKAGFAIVLHETLLEGGNRLLRVRTPQRARVDAEERLLPLREQEVERREIGLPSQPVHRIDHLLRSPRIRRGALDELRLLRRHGTGERGRREKQPCECRDVLMLTSTRCTSRRCAGRA
jgi:hypothetical protein